MLPGPDSDQSEAATQDGDHQDTAFSQAPDAADPATESALATVGDASGTERSETDPAADSQGLPTTNGTVVDSTIAAGLDAGRDSISTTGADRESVNGDAEPPSDPFRDSPDPLASSLPDPSAISTRLKNLVVSISEVEKLSRRAREAATSDLALYEGISASQRQFETGLAEATRIHDEAQTVHQKAFGRDAKAVAEPALLEALEVKQAFGELAGAWRSQASAFLTEHPDVEALLDEQRAEHQQTRRREAARAKAERFQELVSAVDSALRSGQLDDARESLRLLAREFPGETDRLTPLQERLDHRVRAANDAAARRALLHASELQGRGDFDGAVKLLEAVEVAGLSREVSEDVFGRWSAACSLLAQACGIELVRFSESQGRGVILNGDATVPYGLVVFSSLGMGSRFPQGRVVSRSEREGRTIVDRARPFRQADPLAESSNGTWYRKSYVTAPSVTEPVRH
jgi:hypothetical protein